MKHVLFSLLLLCACKSSAVEGSGSGGMGSGADPAPPSGEGQGGGLLKYQPCDKSCTSGCFSIPDGDKALGLCSAPCQTPSDCPAIENGSPICSAEHQCGLSCGTGTCPVAGMKCVSGVCGYPLPAPQ